jgi:gamma-butyrobetaine dioxygenase
LLKSPAFLFEQLATPGDIWVFDNRRVLHGRRGLTAECRERHLEGGYVEVTLL